MCIKCSISLSVRFRLRFGLWLNCYFFKDSVRVMDRFKVKMSLGLGLGSGIKLCQELD